MFVLFVKIGNHKEEKVSWFRMQRQGMKCKQHTGRGSLSSNNRGLVEKSGGFVGSGERDRGTMMREREF